MNTTVYTARRAVGPVGALLPVTFTDMPPVDRQREAVVRLERAGYRTAWTNEVIGKDALVQLAVLLGATERMVFGTSIANIWAREPQTMHAAAAQLAEAHPDRFVLGLGVGYPQQATSTGRDFGKPLTTMRDYRDRMDSQTWPPAPKAAYPRIVAANGPKMLALAGEIFDGALLAGLPPEYTAHARQVLGPDKLLAAIGRLGYSAADIDDVSDRLVDAVIGHGDPATISATVQRQLTAGADHVMVMLPGGDFAGGIDQLEQLAPTLTAMTTLFASRW